MRPDMPSMHVSRRGKIVVGVIVAVIVIVSLLGTLAGAYTNWLWYGEAHARFVYSTILQTRIILFFCYGVVMAAVFGVNIWLAYRMRPPFRPVSAEQENLERYRTVIEPRRKGLFWTLMAIVLLIAGSTGQGTWRTWLAWVNGASFGQTDPQFHKDIGFFVWDYPAYREMLSFGFNAIIFSIIFSLAVHYLFGAVRIVTPGPRFTISARRHITVLAFVFIVLKAIAYWLDRYGLVFSQRAGRGVTGASYTDVHATLHAKTILFWIAIVIAIAVLVSIWLRSAQVAWISFVVLLVLSIGINGIYPTVVQQLSVKPNASDKEATYIQRNIDATRQAYGIATAADPDSATNGDKPATGDAATVSYVDYGTGKATDAEQLQSDSDTVPNIRLADPNIVSPTFTALQQVRSYYGFADKLDIDRYTTGVTGAQTTSDYVVGVRELKAANLNAQQSSWINEHTVYTHGYGIVATKASQDPSQGTATSQGDNNNGQQNGTFAESDIPSTSQNGLPIPKNPQVYYGELGVNYSIVGATGTRENDGAGGKDSYRGSGGVKLSLFNRLAFTIKYRQANFLLNDAVSSKGAKIIYDRDPRTRVMKVAPFLKVDGDPYPTVDPTTGDIVWMLDAYTTTSNYPYSTRQSLGSLTNDTFSNSNKTAAQPDQQINYIRNSVKATVDAFTGKVTLYAWDPTDPVLKTWMRVFPGLIKPASTMPQELQQHVRYPEDLFEVQRALLATYHVSNPVQFYNATDQWSVPDDPTQSTAVDQPPYYQYSAAPDGTGTHYQLTSPMKVNSRPNLSAYISVNSEAGKDYGKFTVLRVPTNSGFQGPQQIYNRFNATANISKDISQLGSGGSTVVHGNLLTLPIGNSFLYVDPLYVESSSAGSFPTLQRVMVAYGNSVGYGTGLTQAIKNLTESVVGQDIGIGSTSTTSPSTSTAPSSSPPSVSPSVSASPSSSAPAADISAVLSQLDAAGKQLQQAYKDGDPAAVGAAEAKILQLTQRYEALRGGSSASSSSPRTTPSRSPSASPS